MKKIFSLCLISLLAFTACNKSDNNNNNNPPSSLEGKTKIGETFVSGIKVTLWSDTAFLVGYNKMYFTLEDSASGAAINNISLTLSIKMDMDGMMMAGPVEAPVFDSTLKGYAGAAVFTMPTNDMMGKWTIVAAFQNPNTGSQDMAMINVDVQNAAFGTVLTQQGTDSNYYVITLIQPAHPQIGLNDMEVLIDKQSGDGMMFTPVNDMSLAVTPQMPSMGGMTTTGNVDPTSTGNGHYLGKINLDMTGDWQLDMKILQGTAVIFDNIHFNFTF